MKYEIERKFLVDSSRLPRLTRPRKVIQGYLCEDPEVRIRISNNKAHITIKTLGVPARKEFEYPIPKSDAEELLELTKSKIEKTRYLINLDGFEWVIDFYKGANNNLVTAEIELENIKSKFKKPLWATKDVTFDLRYRNQSLAKKPFSSWKSRE